MILRGKTEVLGQATLSNTNRTWSGVGLKSVLCAEMPANYNGFNLGLFSMMFCTRVEREPCFIK
jgi:hypothetical protein